MEIKKLPDDFWTVDIDVDPLAQDPDVGADLKQIEAHQTELGGIVEQMWKDMACETKLLEGTEIAEREQLHVPTVSAKEEEEWIRTKQEAETQVLKKWNANRGELQKRIEELSTKQETKE